MTLPSTLTSLGTSTFHNCQDLVTLYYKPTVPPESGNPFNYELFEGCGKIETIYVSTGLVSTYKETLGWMKHAEKIVGYDFK